MAAALTRIFGDISDTHNDCCCTAAAVAPLTLREGLLPSTHKQQRQKAKVRCFFFQFSFMKHPHLKNAFFDVRNPEIFRRGPRSSIDSNSSCSFRENRVDVATRRTTIQPPSRIQATMHPASTSSVELAAVVCVGRTRPARISRLKFLLFAENKK